jgi:hypothetical protein
MGRRSAVLTIRRVGDVGVVPSDRLKAQVLPKIAPLLCVSHLAAEQVLDQFSVLEFIELSNILVIITAVDCVNDCCCTISVNSGGTALVGTL